MLNHNTLEKFEYCKSKKQEHPASDESLFRCARHPEGIDYRQFVQPEGWLATSERKKLVQFLGCQVCTLSVVVESASDSEEIAELIAPGINSETGFNSQDFRDKQAAKTEERIRTVQNLRNNSF